MSDKIEFPAKYIVFWPGQEVMACENHFRRLHGLNNAMGGVTLSSRLLEDMDETGECSNCRNEQGDDGE